MRNGESREPVNVSAFGESVAVEFRPLSPAFGTAFREDSTVGEKAGVAW